MRPVFAFILAVLIAGSEKSGNKPGTLVVSAAAGLDQALPEIARRFTQQTGIGIHLNFGPVEKLAAQIRQGAPVDLFVSSDRSTVQQLEREGHVIPGTVATYAFGRLVLCTPPNSKNRMKRIQDLASPAVQRIAIVNPNFGPYGAAAREALQAVGLWDKIQDRVVKANTSRQVVQYVETGTVDAGFTAISLVIRTKIPYVFVPEKLYRPVEHALCVVKGTQHEKEARQFADFICKEGRDVLVHYGLRVVNK